MRPQPYMNAMGGHQHVKSTSSQNVAAVSGMNSNRSGYIMARPSLVRRERSGTNDELSEGIDNDFEGMNEGVR